MIPRSRIVRALASAVSKDAAAASSPPSSSQEVAEKKELKLSFACPHVAYYKGDVVRQVNLSGEDGDVGILAGHAPMLIQLRPGMLSVLKDEGATSYFVAGGFATINPRSELHVATMEAVPLDHLDGEAVAKGLQEASTMATRLASSSDAKERAISQIVLQAYQAMNAALNAPLSSSSSSKKA
jgi:F-type H+-transporting ATPase subunit delta